MVNPVNCKGISGAGLALEFKKRYPKIFEYYRKTCIEGTYKDIEWHKVSPPGHWSDGVRSAVNATSLLGHSLVCFNSFDEHGNRRNRDTRPLFVLCTATMFNPGEVCGKDVIASCIKSIFSFMYRHKDDFNSLAIPAIGCGIGRFDFDSLCRIIISEYSDLIEDAHELDLTVCRPM